jgi:imidazolonepropionase-like amidohydrolase
VLPRGQPAPCSLPGIEPGAPADLVGYRTDPREDLSALASPQLLVLDGRVMRS